MTAALREADDAYTPDANGGATLELTPTGLEVNDPVGGLTFYFSRSGNGDAKILRFAQNLIAEINETEATK